MTTHPYRQYQATQVQTSGKKELILLSYDGAIRFLAQAREAMQAKRYDVQSSAIGKAQALLTELANGLDFERGGQIAANLYALYTYLFDRLTHASIRDDIAALDEVRASLADLRDAWAEAARSVSASGAVSEGSRAPFAVAV